MGITRLGLTGPMAAYPAFSPKAAEQIVAAEADYIVQLPADDLVVQIPPDQATVTM